MNAPRSPLVISSKERLASLLDKGKERLNGNKAAPQGIRPATAPMHVT